MAATAYAVLRRRLMQRMGYWAGHNSTGNVGSLTSVNANLLNCADSNRTEPDTTFDNAWMVINPGTASVAWVKIAQYIQSGGQFTLQNALPAGTVAPVSYEIFQAAKPEQMLEAVNWALTMAYPQRHFPVDFEIQEDTATRIYDYKQLALNGALTDPSSPPVVTAVADARSTFLAGTYQVSYAWVGEVGKTKESPTASITLAAGQGIDVAQIAALDGAIGVEYYVSLEAGSTVRGSIATGNLILATTAPVGAAAGRVLSGQGLVPEVLIMRAPQQDALLPTLYNATALDIQELYQVQRRSNQNQSPEMWNSLGADMWTPIGGTRIQLQYRPQEMYRLRFLGSSPLLELVNETDVTSEPVEMILNGAEYYLWHLLSKTANIQAVNWEKLAAMAQKDYMQLKDKYAMDQPVQFIHRPSVQVSY